MTPTLPDVGVPPDRDVAAPGRGPVRRGHPVGGGPLHPQVPQRPHLHPAQLHHALAPLLRQVTRLYRSIYSRFIYVNIRIDTFCQKVD